MKITGTRSYIDVETDGKVVRFSGELGVDGFYAARNSAHWLPPHDLQPITSKECSQIIEKIKEKSTGKSFQVFFD